MQKILSILLAVMLFSMFQSLAPTEKLFSSTSSSGVDITYEISISAPPNEEIKITATYSGFTSPIDLQIGYENWSDPTLDVFKEISFSSTEGEELSWNNVNSKTLQVSTSEDTVIANYVMDLQKISTQRGTKVSSIGGALSGYQAFLLPDLQDIDSIKVKFSTPASWEVISFFPVEGDWFEITPITYADLLLEAKSADWYFGIIDFDQTKTYDDGFKIRVVGFKNFPYEHWNVYMGDSPLDEAFKSADFYHETYLHLKEIFGEYPYSTILLVGPGYWQTRSTYMRDQIVGWYRYEYIPHHMIHSYFGMQGSKVGFSGRTYFLMGEGYTTYSEGMMSAEIAEEPYWKGMMYERKFHYIRGMKFGNLSENSNQDYVLGFIVTYLMDQEIRNQTNGEKGIDDLMALLWQKYKTPDFVWISDEQLLQTLKDLTGQDWYGFYLQNMMNTNQLDVDQLDNLKGDFEVFLKVVSDSWFNGYPAMYFVSQEIVSAIGNFDMEVRLQSRNATDFTLEALNRINATKTDLTEEDVEVILSKITGKDHTDFFEFYQSQGFEIDLQEINDYVRTYTYQTDGMDNAVRLFPNTLPLGKSTLVMGELVDEDFASSRELLLQVTVNKKPTGFSDMEDLITGENVSFQFSQNQNYIYSLPIIKVGGKAYTFFTVNIPQEDAGIMQFSFWAKNANPTIDNYLGGFNGTLKVTFQNDSTFYFKPTTYTIEDHTPPILYITTPTNQEVNIESSNYCIEGYKEPGASLDINGNLVTIDSASYQFKHCLDLNPGSNIIRVIVTDKAGNATSQEISITTPGTKLPISGVTPGSNHLNSAKSLLSMINFFLFICIGVMAVILINIFKKGRLLRMSRKMSIFIFAAIGILAAVVGMLY